MVLPSIALGLVSAGILMRMMRRSVIDESGEEYVRTARAKGASEFKVFYGHIMRNALLPYMTLVGIEAGILLSGTVITESIFALPGLGRLMIENILHRDYPVVQAAVFVITAIYVLANFLIDFLYTVLDPRIKVK
jgi:peptide/nickel transport system permease protein